MIFSGILVVFLIASVWNCVDIWKHTRGWRRSLAFPGNFLLAAGALGLFSQAVSSVGGLDWLPPSFEWPAGYVKSALTTSNGVHVVLLQGAARIQVYDSRWRFLRGWRVVAPLQLHLLSNGTMEVLSKGEQGYVFDLNGRLIAHRFYGSQESLTLGNSLAPSQPVFVPTPAWLYLFSSPFLSGVAMLAGGLCWFAIEEMLDRGHSEPEQRR